MSEFRASSFRGPAAILLLCSALSAQRVDRAVEREAAREDFPAAPSRPPLDPAQARPAHRVPSEPADLQATLRSPLEGLLHDEVGGTQWVSGAAYKASFDSASATIVPFFGSEAPRNYPLSMSAEAALGGAPIDGAGAGVSRRGSTIEIDRGGFVEQYRLAPDSLEQLFVFERLEGSGELVVRLALQTELAASDLGSTLRFENELGRIDYGQAFALDADGTRIELDSRLAGGAIELVVPAEFVESAELPLVIDPMITFFTLSASLRDELQPDIAYDLSTDKWCAVWTSVFSQSDHDLFARFASGSGTALTNVVVDITSTLWTTPQIANNNATDRFLVVAAVVPASGVAQVDGRVLFAATETAAAPVPISPADGAYRNWPDVGGDPYPTNPSYFCVVWQRSAGPNDVDIEAKLVTVDGVAQTPVFPLEASPQWHEFPSISKSNGVEGSASPALWTVTWQHRIDPTNHDIYGAQIRWNGMIEHGMFPIAPAGDNTMPIASTLLDPGAFGGGERLYMVAFQRRYTTDHDVEAVVMKGKTVLQHCTLMFDFEHPWLFLEQTNPTVDSDGYHFLIGYEERPVAGAANADLRVSEYFWNGAALQPSEVHQTYAVSLQPELDFALASQASSGGPRRTYGGASCYQSQLGTAFDIELGLWQGHTGGAIRGFCYGDTTWGACPCNDTGAAGHGCPNSANPSGALLSWTGEASVSVDTLTFAASGMPSTATCLLFQSPTLIAGGFAVHFGDGLRCVGSPAQRLGLHSSAGGATSYPLAGELPLSVTGSIPSIGGTFYYQAWYRDPASFCTADTYNLTNAIEVIWAP